MATAPTRSEGLESLVRDPEANPVAILHAMDEATSREWRDWLPETVADFVGLVDDDVQQRDKVMAVQVAATNPDAFDVWHAFNACVIAFNHRRVNFQWLDKPTIPELAWGCVAMRKIGQHAFGTEVLRYIASIMIDDGLTFFPWIGGEGLVLCDDGQEWSRGLMSSPEICELGRKVKAIWDSGDLTELEPSDVDPENLAHVQLSSIVRAQTYIRSQKPEGKKAQ